MEATQPVSARGLHQLGELLHWEGLDEMRKRLGVERIEGRVSAKVHTHPTEEVLRRISREYRVAEDVFGARSGHTVRMIHTLGENCFYAFSAPTNTPYESKNTPDGHAIAAAVAKALCHGRSHPLSMVARRDLVHGRLDTRPRAQARMTIGLPGAARFGGMLVYPRYLTLEFRFMRFLRAVVLEACKEVQALQRASRKGRYNSFFRKIRNTRNQSSGST